MTQKSEKNTRKPSLLRTDKTSNSAAQALEVISGASKHTEKYTIYIALLALLLSIFSTIASWNTYKITANQTLQDKLLVLKGIFDKEDNLQIMVKPISNNSFFLEGTAFLPSPISKSPSPIEASGQILYMGDTVLSLENLILEKHKPLEGKIQFTKINIPMVIKSRYIAKGLQYSDLSLYMLRADVLINPLPKTNAKITFTSLNFMGRMDMKESAQDYVDDLYKSGSVVVTPPKPTL